MSRLMPVSAAADGIYNGQLIDASKTAYWTAECVEIEGDVDVERLKASVSDTVIDAEALHARFVATPQGLRQEVDVDENWSPDVVDLRGEPDARTHVQRHTESMLSMPADLALGRLFRSVIFLARDRVYWHLQAHHIVLDGFGYALLYRHVSRRYNGGHRPGDGFGRLEPLVDDDVEYQRSRQCETDGQQWAARLDGVNVTGFSDGVAARLRKPLRRELSEVKLDAYGAAWPHRLAAAVAAALHRRTGSREPVLGMAVADRLRRVAAKVPSMTMNIMPLPVPVEAGATIDDMAAAVAAELADSRKRQRYRHERLRRELGRFGASGRLFGPVVNVIPFDEAPRFDGCRTVMHHLSAGPVDDLTITARGPRNVVVEANPELYSAQDLAKLDAELTALLDGSASPSRWSVVDGPPAPPTPPIASLLDARAADSAVAVEDGSDRVGYADLISRARRVGELLNARGVGAGDLVGVRMPRGVEAVTALLGVLRSGAGYLPLDPDGAPEREAAVIAEARPVLTLTPEPSSGSDAVGTDSPTSVVAQYTLAQLSAAPKQPSAPPRAASGSDPAYVIYTSGSTGRPKGVSVSRSALDFFVASAVLRYGFTPSDRVLQFAPLHFDAHVEEVFATLVAGATLVIRDDSATASLDAFARFCRARDITVLDLPTAYWHELAWAVGNGRLSLPDSVATVIIGGEAADPTRVRQWHDAVQDSSALINTYGPTEATVVCVAHTMRPGEPVVLGSPLPGVQVAIGPGDELYVCGPGLASGYLDGDHDCFVYVDGRRWYRTGDLVALRDDGLLEYRGRVDTEVKIAGHRIQPREVEAAIGAHSAVREVAVCVEHAAGATSLIAHVVADVGAEQLRAHAARRLPAAALPAQFVDCDQLPRTPSGKVDRAALRAPRADVDVSTFDPLRRDVYEVFAETLPTPPPSTGADFFACGGTSLSAVAAASRLSDRLGREVAAAQIFAAPNVDALAALLSGDAEVVDETTAMHADAAWSGPEPTPGHAELDAVTVTGASGFVGSELAAAFARHGRRVVCLLRGGAARLPEIVQRHRLDADAASRIQAADCDLASPGLGLDRAGRALVADTQAVVHCAADVSLARGYDSMRQVNVEATRRLLELAGADGKHFCHVSTVAVGAHRELPEDFVDAHDGLRDGYQRSKWAAEELVRQAAADGLGAACCRLGRVTPPHDGRRHNPDDLIWRLAQAGRQLKSLPQLEIAEPWMDVDVVAECLRHMVERRARGVWNLTLGQPVRLSEVWAAICAEDPDVEVVPLPDWLNLLRRRSAEVPAGGALHAFFSTRSGQSAPPAPRIRNDRFLAWLTEVGYSPEPARARTV